ncbi:unnamed protein product [Choristocarpus tenellus]
MIDEVETGEGSHQALTGSPHVGINTMTCLSFRITGPASVKRIQPLLRRNWGGYEVVWSQRGMSACPRKGRGAEEKDEVVRKGGFVEGELDFVWETTVSKDWKEAHRAARVLNRLSGAQILVTISLKVLEDKGNLALLQRRMWAPTLESYVANGRDEVQLWAQERWGVNGVDSEKILSKGRPCRQGEGIASKRAKEACPGPYLRSTNAKEMEVDVDGVEKDWWCTKATCGNGGMDIWVMHNRNWTSIVRELSKEEEYVIQRYVINPMLWRGHKFHFRLYAALSAGLQSWMYKKAYLLSASHLYSVVQGGTEVEDELMHISNLATNKHTKGHPGQVPCNLPAEYPALWPQMKALMTSLVEAASPFMAHQARTGHFEFLGLDVIADAEGGVWLMEVNRLPGLQSSRQNKEEEDVFYDTMVVDLLQLLVLPALVGCQPKLGYFEASPDAVSPPFPGVNAESSETWKNVLEFAAFKRRCLYDKLGPQKISSKCDGAAEVSGS